MLNLSIVFTGIAIQQMFQINWKWLYVTKLFLKNIFLYLVTYR